jgi:hypothetical protein
MISVPPVLVLWLYQWRAFGNPFLPGQHWMPPVEFIDLGYQGYGVPQLELIGSLLFDYRYGLFAVAPVLALGLAAPLLRRRGRLTLPRLEELACLAIFASVLVFFAGSKYTRLQWNTGIRYMTPVLPFLFLPAAMVLLRLPRVLMYAVGIGSVVVSWCMAMNREVWQSLGVLHPVAHVFTNGFQLPALTTIERMRGLFGDLVPGATSPLPFLALAGVLIYLIWTVRPGAERQTAAPAPSDRKGAA